MKTKKVLLADGGFTPKPSVVALPPFPNPGCATALVQSRMSEVHPCDITDKLRAVQLSMLKTTFFKSLGLHVMSNPKVFELSPEFLN